MPDSPDNSTTGQQPAPSRAGSTLAWQRLSPEGRRALRIAAVCLVGLAAFAVTVAFAYQLALARVPQHRAALERLVRSQTGLDIRFNELDLRWGWYGPEAVFRKVELGEPGKSNVLLRAPQLLVGFDALKTIRTRQLAAGRITLVAPDIDFERLGRDARNPDPVTPQPEESAAPRVKILQRWRDGRIDIESGTLRLPDPAGTANPFSLHIRRASLRRSEDEWSASGLAFLPERLGRSARFVVRVNGDISRIETLTGSLKFEGYRLAFNGWRDVLGAWPRLAKNLPLGGTGDVAVDLTLARGRVQKASGEVRAVDVSFAKESGTLALERLSGAWQIARRGSGWQAQINDLMTTRDDSKGAISSLRLDIAADGRSAHGELARAPVQALAPIASWFAPGLALDRVKLAGDAKDVSFEWDAQREAGNRLQLSAQLEEFAVASRTSGTKLSGLAATVSGAERAVDIHLASKTGRLDLADDPERPWLGLHLASDIQLVATDSGWRASTERLAIDHEEATLTLSGAVEGGAVGVPLVMNVSGELRNLDVTQLQQLLGDGLASSFGAVTSDIRGGHVDAARFELNGAPDARAFNGTLTLRDGELSGGELWPDVEDVGAQIEWKAGIVTAVVTTGKAGAFTLHNARARWYADGSRAADISGQINGRIEDALAWVNTHPSLHAYVPDIHELQARGDARFDVELRLPPATAAMPAETVATRPPVSSPGPLRATAADLQKATALPADATGLQRNAALVVNTADVRAQRPARQSPAESKIRARVVATLLDADIDLFAELPPLLNVRGGLVFDTGRLQRSSLTANWLGGPVSLRVGERRERRETSYVLTAQGLLDARELAALLALDNTDAVSGRSEWTGDFTWHPAVGQQLARWRARIDSSLSDVTSELPVPLNKNPGRSLPLHIGLSGAGDTASLQVDLANRVRSTFALQRPTSGEWRMDRGGVRLGDGGTAVEPGESLLLVEGRLSTVDLPAYIAMWNRALNDATLPELHADLSMDELHIAGRSYPNVTLQTQRGEHARELVFSSPILNGSIRWPDEPSTSSPIEMRFVDLDISERAPDARGSIADALSLLGATTRIYIDRLSWNGRLLGRMTARLQTRDSTTLFDDAHLTNTMHEASGSVRCQNEWESCRVMFELDSKDAATTLRDFGFRDDIAARHATLRGDVTWNPRAAGPWLASATGQLNMRLTDGSAHPHGSETNSPFALFAAPALMAGLAQAALTQQPVSPQRGGPGPLSAGAPEELNFTRLEADFELRDGDARTSNLHLDGDAEILMRGRTGLVARDYDHEVWVLRGEDRLPAAVRRLGATPRVAAAWITLRELLGGNDNERTRTVLRLHGSWNEPVVAAN